MRCKIGLRLKQRCLGRAQARLCVDHAAGSLAGGLLFCGARLRNLVAKAGQHGFRGLAIGGEFLRVQHGDGVTGFDFSAFVHGQALNAPAHFGADNDLVGVNGADQHKIGRMVGREKVIDGGDDQQQPEKGKEAVALAHGLQTFCAAAGVKTAAQMKSSTAARRAAIRSGEAGSPACMNCCAGMLMK